MIKVTASVSFSMRIVHEAMFSDATNMLDHTALSDVIAIEDVISEILRQADRPPGRE
jgi:hypothetical protein